MLYTLVVCEKPDAARRIAQALGDAKESRQAGVSVFDVVFDGVHYKICSASGHLYGVTDSTRNRSVYPVLDLEWAPLEKKTRRIGVISKLAQGASDFIHACDYDQEGEVIGHSILQYACGSKYAGAKRAKFSTLTDDEVRESFRNLLAPSRGLAEAGRSRHLLDFIYGVNLSRALAQSFLAGNKGYRNLSIGRVQGPALAFAADRELEIGLHVPDPYWAVSADFDKARQIIHACYKERQVGTLAEAQEIVSDCTGRDGAVSRIGVKKVTLAPPAPLSTGDLQREAYRLFKVPPSYALAIAEKLYLRALISYPRTASQKLPPSIDYRKILSGLAGSASYSRPASVLLARGRLLPHEGPGTDPAHPAIYPTGLHGQLSGLEFKIYDLIARRFLAAFGDAAVRENTEVEIDVQGHAFIAEGQTTLYDGWIVFYKPYVNLEQLALPELQRGDVLGNREVAVEEKFTQPPPRCSQATLLAKMEQERIGTKATRAEIISTLFKRGYLEAVRGGMQVTDLGLVVVGLMREHAPAIVSTELTRSMEEQLEKVEQEMDPVEVIGSAAGRLVESLAAFRGNEERIGKSISATTQSDKVIGQCPMCKEGQLRIIRSKATKKRFVGCSRYAYGCRASAPLPQRGAIKPAGACRCGWPKISVAFGRGRRWKICVNVQCPLRSKSN